MLSELPFAACYAYSPRGTSDVARKSRRIRDWVKAAVEPALAKMAARVRREVDDGTFGEFFGENVALIPVPGSTPRKDPATLWVAQRVCHALVAEGLGSTVLTSLQRTHQVPKSAFQPRGNRPNVRTHYDSFSVKQDLLQPESILLVDDIVTKGCTLLAAASRVQESYPRSDVRAFAMVRTMGLVPDIDKTLHPCVGIIHSQIGNDADRQP